MPSPQRKYSEPSPSQRRRLGKSMTSLRQLVESKGAVQSIHKFASDHPHLPFSKSPHALHQILACFARKAFPRPSVPVSLIPCFLRTMWLCHILPLSEKKQLPPNQLEAAVTAALSLQQILNNLEKVCYSVEECLHISCLHLHFKLLSFFLF